MRDLGTWQLGLRRGPGGAGADWEGLREEGAARPLPRASIFALCAPRGLAQGCVLAGARVAQGHHAHVAKLDALLNSLPVEVIH